MKNVFFLIVFMFSCSKQDLNQSDQRKILNAVTQENEHQCKKVILVDDILGIEVETEVCEPVGKLSITMS